MNITKFKNSQNNLQITEKFLKINLKFALKSFTKKDDYKNIKRQEKPLVNKHKYKIK